MGAGSSLAAIRQLEFEEAGAEGLSLEYPTVRSIKELVEQIERESGEPPPVPKKTQLKKIGGLMRQMGVLKTAAGVKYMEAREVELESFGFDDTENGHDMLAERIEASGPIFEKLNRGAMLPTPGTAFPIALVADQDEGDAGKDLADACSYLAYGKLVYNGAAGAASYSIDLPGEQPIRTAKGDSAGRGVEYSALEVFANRMITADDRTGALDEIVKCGDRFNFRVQPLVNAAGDELSIKTGDGSTDEPLACEWSTQKQGKMLVGSTGIERPDGNEGDMWIVSIDANTLEIMQHDWRPMYRSLRNAAGCAHPNGYMVHEGCRWSDYHCYWFFLPRQLSREPFDEEKHARKCSNLMLAVPGILPGAPPRNESGDDVIMQPYLTKQAGRGCSDFLFIPGTNDTHFFLLRTEESEDGAISTYGSVIDLEANVLMEEVIIATDKKYEGAAWVGGFGPFPKEGPADDEKMLRMERKAKTAKKPTPQCALVFILPHAVYAGGVRGVIEAKFREQGIRILSEGGIEAKAIDEHQLIDKHFYPVASKATMFKPEELNVPKDKFQAAFGEDWDQVVYEGRVLNALDMSKLAKVDAATMEQAWADAVTLGHTIKISGGFYCGKVDIKHPSLAGGSIFLGKPAYTINGFFMATRAKFVAPDSGIYYYEVEFDAARLAWADFRAKVLGPTDPSTAPPRSIRGKLYAEWHSLDLPSPPTASDNAVHFSASPLEGLAERVNWLQIDPSTDPFYRALLYNGISKEMIEYWLNDPQVLLPDKGASGKRGSIFDQLEDMDFADAVKTCKAIAAANKGKVPPPDKPSYTPPSSQPTAPPPQPVDATQPPIDDEAESEMKALAALQRQRIDAAESKPESHPDMVAVDEEDPEQVAAATKLQAGVRGRRARSSLGKGAAPSDAAEEEEPGAATPATAEADNEDPEQVAAATKLQAGVRGRRARSSLGKGAAPSDAVEEPTAEEPTAEEPTAEEPAAEEPAAAEEQAPEEPGSEAPALGDAPQEPTVAEAAPAPAPE